MPRPVVIPDGSKIIQLRGKQGFTQDELAVRSGYAKRTIERLEAGQRTRRVTLLEVARCLGVDGDTLIIPISYGLDEATTDRIEQWVDSKVQWQELDDLRKFVSVQDLLAPPDSAVPATRLICEWSSGIREYRLRRNVTVGEFCAALRDDLFQGKSTHEHLSIGLSGRKLYDPALTVSDVERRSGGKVKIYRFRGGGILGTATGPSYSCIDALAHAAQGRTGLNARICRFYLWLFNRAIFDSRWSSPILGLLLGTLLRFVIAELNHMSWAYAESGTNTDDAARMSKIILKVPGRLLSTEYFDTLAWVKYRCSDFSGALKLLETTGTSDAAYMYHLFFVLRALHKDAAADDIKLRFHDEDVVGRRGLEWLRVGAEDDAAVGEFSPKRPRLFVPYFIQHAIQGPIYAILFLIVVPIVIPILGVTKLVERVRRKRTGRTEP